jgi:hypothetical protein
MGVEPDSIIVIFLSGQPGVLAQTGVLYVDDLSLSQTTEVEDTGFDSNLFTLYPIPAGDHFFIENPTLGNGKPVTIRILDLFGKKVFEKKLNSFQNKTRVSLPYQGRGLHLVQIMDNSGTWLFSKKLVFFE